MDLAEVKDIARRFIQVWNAGHVHIVDELAAPDLVVSYPHFPEPLRGAEAFKAALKQTHHCFPDLAIEVRRVLAEEDTAVVHWTYRGTHRTRSCLGWSRRERRSRSRG